MQFHVITIFPNLFDSYLSDSIIGRAVKEKKIKIAFYDPRAYVTGKYKTVWSDGNTRRQVDERPYGGGPGMIMRPEPILKAVEKAVAKIRSRKNTKPKIKIIFFTPSGEKFTTDYAKKTTTKYTDVIMICGRYEGIDARVQQILKADEISIGDYVLTGGELPALILIDCMARQIAGVLGNYDSREEERTASPEVYTRPEVLEYNKKKYRVPPVLLSGNHKDIEAWKREQTEKTQK